MDLKAMSKALAMLSAKYGIMKTGALEKAPDATETGVESVLKLEGNIIRLLPWRVMRRFTELKNLASGPTLQDISTLRFSYFAGGLSLEALMYRELDLCEWVGGAPAVSLFSVGNGKAASNTIVKLANQVSCSVEVSNKLPPGTAPADRHEVIARRGVACDRVVDTQVPQSSIYLYGTSGESRYTDEDAELFGLTPDEAFAVRAAFAALKDPETANCWNARHEHLSRLVMTATESMTHECPAALKEEA